MMIFNVPIESLEERYSAQWNLNFPESFKRSGAEFKTIYPTVKRDISKIQRGEFLDAVNTNLFKASQLVEICDLFNEKDGVSDGDVFFFHDLWFPGLEMLFYIRDALKINFKICGMIHAGSYDPNDFLYRQGMYRWAKTIEQSWFNHGIDRIFVATRYHKELLMRSRLVNSGKIWVTGFPLWDLAAITEPTNKRFKDSDLCVFPHRLAPEKQPEKFEELERMLQDKFPFKYRLLKTKDVCRTKYEYYHMLEKAKVAVSCALQETWGIAQQEAVLRDCLPLVPDRLSYVEMYPGFFCYKTQKELEKKTVEFMENYDEIVESKVFQMTKMRLIISQQGAFGKMLDSMKKLSEGI